MRIVHRWGVLRRSLCEARSTEEYRGKRHNASAKADLGSNAMRTIMRCELGKDFRTFIASEFHECWGST